jgi:hypothetical protein
MLMERAVEYQPDNTRYWLDYAGLLLATHQRDRAVEALETLLAITKPSDADKDEARKNRETAESMLRQLNESPAADPPAAPPTTQP